MAPRSSATSGSKAVWSHSEPCTSNSAAARPLGPDGQRRPVGRADDEPVRAHQRPAGTRPGGRRTARGRGCPRRAAGPPGPRPGPRQQGGATVLTPAANGSRLSEPVSSRVGAGGSGPPAADRGPPGAPGAADDRGRGGDLRRPGRLGLQGGQLRLGHPHALPEHRLDDRASWSPPASSASRRSATLGGSPCPAGSAGGQPVEHELPDVGGQCRPTERAQPAEGVAVHVDRRPEVFATASTTAATSSNSRARS